jgi:hypothetical protein
METHPAPPGPQAGQRLGAVEQYQRIQLKLKGMGTTLQVIEHAPALPPAVFDRLQALQAEQGALKGRVAEAWNNRMAPVQQAQNAASNAQTAAIRARAAGDAAQVEETARALREAEVVQARVQAELLMPDGVLDGIAPEVDELAAQVNDLHLEAIQNTSLARAGEQVVSVNREEFARGRDYHRRHALGLLIGMVLLAGAGAAGVIWLFGAWPAPGASASADHTEAWIHLGLVLGGRFSVLVGLGWLLVFVGRMHSRHAQQAVSYQERLAGLDAAKMVIHHGTGKVREHLLLHLTSTYLSMEGNAFRERRPRARARFSLRELRTVTRAIADVRGTGPVQSSAKRRVEPPGEAE